MERDLPVSPPLRQAAWAARGAQVPPQKALQVAKNVTHTRLLNVQAKPELKTPPLFAQNELAKFLGLVRLEESPWQVDSSPG